MRKKITVLLSIIAAAVLTLTGCSYANVNSFVDSQNNRVTETNESTMELDMPKASNLVIKNTTGGIHVSKTDGDKIKIRTVRKVQGNDEKQVKEVLDNIETRGRTSWFQYIIDSVTKKGNGDFWSWKRRHHNNVNVNIDYYIELPEDFKAYDVYNVTGQIDLSNISGKLHVKNTTGTVNLKEVTPTDYGQISQVTGSLNLDVNLQDSKGLKVTNTTGNINISIPENSSLKYDAKLTTGVLGGNYPGLTFTKPGLNKKINQNINGGGKSLTVRLITGNINLNKK